MSENIVRQTRKSQFPKGWDFFFCYILTYILSYILSYIPSIFELKNWSTSHQHLTSSAEKKKKAETSKEMHFGGETKKRRESHVKISSSIITVLSDVGFFSVKENMVYLVLMPYCWVISIGSNKFVMNFQMRCPFLPNMFEKNAPAVPVHCK